jgi:vacuolar-type H+-ATPase subunit H
MDSTTEQQDGGAQQATEQAREKAGEVADQAREKAQNLSGQAADQVRTQVDQRSTEAGERITATADDLRSVGESLREQGKDGPAKMADQVAERAERAGGYLRDADANQILGDLEDFGRRQPWAVLAGAAVAGVAAARLLKASSRNRYQGQAGQITTGTAHGGGVSSSYARPAAVTERSQAIEPEPVGFRG